MADFVVVYIEEAHPSDGWFFHNNISIPQHRKLDDRIMAARKLEDIGTKCPIVVDQMSNDANKRYGALFERLYVIQDGVIVYAGERGPVGYKVEELESWLQNYKTGKAS